MKTFFLTIITFLLSVTSNAQWVQKNSLVSEDEQISSININKRLVGSNFAILNMMGQRVLSGKINSRSTLLEVGGLSG